MTSQQQSLKKEADVVFQQHNFRKAIELYTNAINVDPSTELAGTLFSNRSLCHHKLGNFQEALNDGITATTLKPNWARGYLRVAVAFESLGKEDEAIEAYQKSLDLEENEETRRIYIALFRKNVDNMKKTQEELKVIGNGYVQKRKYEEAVIIYNSSIDLDPSIESAAPIYSNRSLAFFNLGRFQEAEDDGCMAIFLKPEFARGYLRRGNAAMKLEKWQESDEAYDKYFELDPENAKSDPDLVKNKNSVKKAFHVSEDKKQRREAIIEKTRAELMAIKDETERKTKARTLIVAQVQNPSSFDVDLARMLLECGVDLGRPGETVFGRMFRGVPAEGAARPVLVSMLACRLAVSPKIILQFDELLFFIIDEMSRRNIPFARSELSMACERRNAVPVNPKLVRVLLETNKFDVNHSIAKVYPTPLVALLSGMLDSVEMPREAPDCLHLLLNWKGIDVNAVSHVVAADFFSVEKNTPLGCVRHPEVAKILIRYGANVNAVFPFGDGLANVFHVIFNRPHNPDLEELVRLLIQSGARMLPDGRNGKSSIVIFRLLGGCGDRETGKKSFVSEEVLQMMLQLNLHQGLPFKWESPDSLTAYTFLISAICNDAPVRFVELLCAMNPAATKEAGTRSSGDAMTVTLALSARMVGSQSTFVETMQVLGVLLDYGFNLFEPVSKEDPTIAFVSVWNMCRVKNSDMSLLKKTIIEKRGQAEYDRCMKLTSNKNLNFF